MVTTFSESDVNQAHDKAKEIFGDMVTEVIESPVNQYYTFFVSPDGSKEGKGGNYLESV